MLIRDNLIRDKALSLSLFLSLSLSLSLSLCVCVCLVLGRPERGSAAELVRDKSRRKIRLLYWHPA